VAQALVAPPTAAPRVLLVDDCETSLLFQELALAGACQVLKARDGRQALRIAAKERVDLVLLDLGLQGLDGLEVLRGIRRLGPEARTPVIVVSVRGDDETIARAFQDGCTDYLTKPVSASHLLRAVRRHLRR
jgi:DNA-binding response OmpR family regulator